MLKRIDEVKTPANIVYAGLKDKLQSYDTPLKELSCTALQEILKTYSADLGLNHNKIYANRETDKVISDLIDWFSASGSTGNFILDFAAKDGKYDGLSFETIYKLIQLDPKMQKAIIEFGKRYRLINKDGKEIVRLDPLERGVRGREVPFYELCEWIFKSLNTLPKNTLKSLDDLDITNLEIPEKDTDDDKYYYKKPDSELFKSTLEALKHIYYNLNESKEDEFILNTDIEAVSKDEADEIKNSADVDVEETEEKETEVTLEKDDPEISDAYMKTGIKELVNQLITDFWGVISKINSGITTIDYDFKGDEKESLLEILNNVADEATISVGMLSKASSLLDEKALKLMTQGEKKADKLIRK